MTGCRMFPGLAEDNPDSWLASLPMAQSASVHTCSWWARPSPVASPPFPRVAQSSRRRFRKLRAGNEGRGERMQK